MLSVANKPLMLSAANTPFMLNVVMLSVYYDECGALILAVDDTGN
jgi:hypothetical protein